MSQAPGFGGPGNLVWQGRAVDKVGAVGHRAVQPYVPYLGGVGRKRKWFEYLLVGVKEKYGSLNQTHLKNVFVCIRNSF